MARALTGVEERRLGLGLGLQGGLCEGGARLAQGRDAGDRGGASAVGILDQGGGFFFVFPAMDACLRQQYALAAAVLALVLYVVYLATMGG